MTRWATGDLMPFGRYFYKGQRLADRLPAKAPCYGGLATVRSLSEVVTDGEGGHRVEYARRGPWLITHQFSGLVLYRGPERRGIKMRRHARWVCEYLVAEFPDFCSTVPNPRFDPAEALSMHLDYEGVMRTLAEVTRSWPPPAQ